LDDSGSPSARHSGPLTESNTRANSRIALIFARMAFPTVQLAFGPQALRRNTLRIRKGLRGDCGGA